MLLKMVAAAAVVVFLILPVRAQAPAGAGPAGQQSVSDAKIPRMPDGHPNFEGMWYTSPWKKVDPNASGGANGYGAFGAALPDNTGTTGGAAGGASGREGAAGGGRAGRGGGGRGANNPHYLPEAAQIQQALQKYHLFADPEGLCQIPGVPRAFVTPPYPYQFIQDDKSLTMLLEYVHDVRIIPFDNGPHLKNYWAWNGDSRSYWEGDTLVVDVADFNGRAWLNPQGNFFDENLHVVERYTLTNSDTIAYEATVTDPMVLAEPWINRRTFYRYPETEQIFEYGCKEGEHSIQHYTNDLGGKAEVKEGPTK